MDIGAVIFPRVMGSALSELGLGCGVRLWHMRAVAHRSLGPG